MPSRSSGCTGARGLRHGHGREGVGSERRARLSRVGARRDFEGTPRPERMTPSRGYHPCATKTGQVCRKKYVDARSAHEPVAVGAADGLALGEAREAEGVDIVARPLAVDDEL